MLRCDDAAYARSRHVPRVQMYSSLRCDSTTGEYARCPISHGRRHGPFAIRKDIDQASPQLYAALCRNEKLRTWNLEFWGTVPGDHRQGEVQRYAIKLTNASVASMALRTYDATGGAPGSYYEEVIFTYSKIEWIWIDGGISAEDEWNPRDAVPVLVGALNGDG